MQLLRWAVGSGQFPTARTHQLGGRGVLPRRRSMPMERLQVTAVPNGPGLLAWGGREPCSGGGRYLWRACRGRQFPTARAHQLAGRGVLTRRRSVLRKGLRETAVPNGPDSPA